MERISDHHFKKMSEYKYTLEFVDPEKSDLETIEIVVNEKKRVKIVDIYDNINMNSRLLSFLKVHCIYWSKLTYIDEIDLGLFINARNTGDLTLRMFVIICVNNYIKMHNSIEEYNNKKYKFKPNY